jgi:peptidoglycan/LPS O-acetylase OafA/YrhL
MAESQTVARKSNFEVLRILAILMIIAHHVALYGGCDFATGEISVNKLWILLLASGGKIGVNIFILISGYFLISSDFV